MKFKLVPKMNRNLLSIFVVFPNGRTVEISRTYMPDDNQIVDNVHCAEEMCKALSTRIKKSVM